MIAAPALARANLPGHRGGRAQRRDRREPDPRPDRPCQRDGAQDAALLLLPPLGDGREPAAVAGGAEKGTTVSILTMIHCTVETGYKGAGYNVKSVVK